MDDNEMTPQRQAAREKTVPREVLLAAGTAAVLGGAGTAIVTTDPGAGAAIGIACGVVPWVQTLYRTGRRFDAGLLVLTAALIALVALLGAKT